MQPNHFDVRHMLYHYGCRRYRSECIGGTLFVQPTYRQDYYAERKSVVGTCSPLQILMACCRIGLGLGVFFFRFRIVSFLCIKSWGVPCIAVTGISRGVLMFVSGALVWMIRIRSSWRSRMYFLLSSVYFSATKEALFFVQVNTAAFTSSTIFVVGMVRCSADDGLATLWCIDPGGLVVTASMLHPARSHRITWFTETACVMYYQDTCSSGNRKRAPSLRRFVCLSLVGFQKSSSQDWICTLPVASLWAATDSPHSWTESIHFFYYNRRVGLHWGRFADSHLASFLVVYVLLFLSIIAFVHVVNRNTCKCCAQWTAAIIFEFLSLLVWSLAFHNSQDLLRNIRNFPLLLESFLEPTVLSPPLPTSFPTKVSENVYNAFFVDLFVRVSNTLAINMYNAFGYSVYRRVIGYYSGEEDAFGELQYQSAVVQYELHCTPLLSYSAASSLMQHVFLFVVFKLLIYICIWTLLRVPENSH